MATKRYIGLEPAIAQVDTITPGGTIEIGDIFILTVTGLDGSTDEVVFVATATTVANITAGITAAWNNDTSPLTVGVTAVDDTIHITLTSDTPGIGFSVAATTTEAGGGAADLQTFVRAASVANAGPYSWDDTGNWSGGALPGAADDVFVEGHSVYYGLDQSAAGTFTSLRITRSQIGVNPAPGTTPIYLQARATNVDIGYDYEPVLSTQPVPVNVDMGNVQTAIVIHRTGENGVFAGVRILATHANSTLEVLAGSVSVGTEPGETAQFGEITVNDASARNTDTIVKVGTGMTVNSVKCLGGSLLLRSAATTLRVEAGTAEVVGSGAIGTLAILGGLVICSTTGTVSTLEARGGVADFTRSSATRTITSAFIWIPATIKYDPGWIVFTNKIIHYESTGGIALTAAAI